MKGFMMIVQTPPHLMSRDERNDEIALYLNRACQRLLQKKKQARFDGSLNEYKKELQKPKRKQVKYKKGYKKAS
jgi:hypothetical protein